MLFCWNSGRFGVNLRAVSVSERYGHFAVAPHVTRDWDTGCLPVRKPVTAAPSAASEKRADATEYYRALKLSLIVLPTNTKDTGWFAARMLSDKEYVCKQVAGKGFRTYRTQVLPSLLFVHCTAADASALWWENRDKLYFYCAPDRKTPGCISDSEMRSFMLVTSASPDDILLLDVTTPEFLSGQKVRVTGGPFEGAEGVVKRVKGDRRLIVQISGIAVVATSFIHPAFLEAVEEHPGTGSEPAGSPNN